TVFETITLGGFRTGEILQLKLKDVETQGEELIVTVQPETSKVRKTRQVPLLHSAAKYLGEWIQAHPNLTPDDYVFKTDKRMKNPRKNFYKQFGLLRKEVLIPAGLGDLEAYHGRHHRITTWLYMGHSVHDIHKLTGTSIAEIEKTYSG